MLTTKKKGGYAPGFITRLLDAQNRASPEYMIPSRVIGSLVYATLAGLLLPIIISYYFGGWDAALSTNKSTFLAVLLLCNTAIILIGWGRYQIAIKETALSIAAEKKAQSLASTDPLTGLLNRRAMGEAVDDLFFLAQKRKKITALLVIDLDGFKTVNDLHGHLTGDNLLRATAETIRQALPADSVLARLGGGQFAAAFSFTASSKAAAELIISEILDELGRPFDLGGAHIHVSASAGIALAGKECATMDALMRRADIAMHAAKKIGHGRFLWFDASMQRELQSRNATEASIRKGIPRGEFVPYFEQKIDLASGKLIGFEMLARWNHPEKGLVAPDEFITIAEECGLIGDLSMSVMRQAMAEARGWDNSLVLSVNLSPIQLKDPWLAQKIAKLLNETGYPAERLEIEITESALFENLDLVQVIINSLKNQGVQLALDDFGTGYSSLAHLRALPFDRIKIDRSFVTSINENPESAVIVTAITRLADSLNFAITAEGVENELVKERLRSIGIYSAQGWLFGKPMPIGEVRALLAKKGLLPAARNSHAPDSPIRITRTR